MAKTNNKPHMRVAANTSEEAPAPKYKVEAKATTQQTNVLIPRKFQRVPKVWYSPVAWTKMQRAIDKCSQEVGWLGTVQEMENGDYFIDDIYVPEQTVHGAETDIEPEALAQLASELDDPSLLRYWGHSHVNMGVTPSGQDEDQTSEYLEHTDFFIRGIYNKKGISKVDVFDMRTEIVYQAVPNKMLFNPMTDDELDAFDEVLKENVKKYVRQPTPSSHNQTSSRSMTTYNNGGSGSATLTRKERKELRRMQNRRNPFIINQSLESH